MRDKLVYPAEPMPAHPIMDRILQQAYRRELKSEFMRKCKKCGAAREKENQHSKYLCHRAFSGH